MEALRTKEESVRLIALSQTILSELGDSLDNTEVIKEAISRGESFDNACYVSVVYFFG